MEMADDPKNGVLVIGEGVRLTGKIEAPGAVHVHGFVDGEVVASDINVGQSGRIEGSLSAQNVDLRGYAGDTVSAAKHVTIRSSATVVGNIKYQTIEIESGARIEGNLQSLEKTADRAKTAPTVKA